MRELKGCEIDVVAGGEKKPSKPRPKPPAKEPCDCEPTPWYERFTIAPPPDDDGPELRFEDGWGL
jgi:hypothetical protein